MKISKRQQRYAVFGFVITLLVNLLFYALGTSLLGFYLGDIPPLLMRAVPLAIISALLLALSATPNSRPTRLLTSTISIALVIYLHMNWPW